MNQGDVMQEEKVIASWKYKPLWKKCAQEV